MKNEPVNVEIYKQAHRGERIIVAGLGESINSLVGFAAGARFCSIGVNDIGRAFTPTYLLQVNNRNQYTDERWQHIEHTRARALFTHIPHQQPGVKIPIVTFCITKRVGGVEIEGDALPHFRNSPYVGVALAAYMGAAKIGLIGVDFTDGHFWIKDGPHRLNRELEAIDKAYGRMREHLLKQSIELVNLSPISRLTTLPKVNIESFYRCPDAQPCSSALAKSGQHSFSELR